jgi:regulator of replication initiation timing
MEQTQAIVKSCLILQNYITKLEQGINKNTTEPSLKLIEENVRLKSENKELKSQINKLSKENKKLQTQNDFYEDKKLYNKKILLGFLNSPDIKIEKGLFVPRAFFIQVFNWYCQINNLRRHVFNEDFYMETFISKDIEVREDEVTYKGRVYPTQSIIYGLDIAEKSLYFGDDY